ncbi:MULTISPECIES: 2-phosphosulfolactate phosphatase [unclassified Lentimicrobium]|uniref:2-phosphosulfolactate phosphatase n=1 Tax=unclassified Lentimicrobium TaxID=2677434 RepID=UPI0015518F43|nr:MULTISPECIES: 2-phosphosulfolactate phosphatase [unclassified Lentimicrobium]NPD46371.1 2-phosphosulfolactate phosphatase [Lentimicrobium sp. S6]NPD83550.1 2-phosphosulfolactate phosphatase [Lentimicrobium sp. L6]NPD85961.1 2-phosphosulfolactate phosphatase [Lentimicrobium sp. L6]
MHEINVIFRHQDVAPKELVGQVAVVIDVLRATSVMATALANGATKVKTVQTSQQALTLKTQNTNLLLAGERNAIKLAKFDFGNSPLEMRSELIDGKEIVLCTSNGTQAVAIAHRAIKVVTAAFVNMKAVVKRLDLLEEDITIICSGTNGQFSLDDSLAAGILVNRLTRTKGYKLSDSAQSMALAIKDENKLQESLKDCYHLNLLRAKGFKNDVDYCLTLDSLNVVPQLKNGYFVV